MQNKKLNQDVGLNVTTFKEQQTKLCTYDGNLFKIKDINHKIIVYQIVKRKRYQEQVYNYALVYPQEEICLQVIENFENSIPKDVHQNNRIEY